MFEGLDRVGKTTQVSLLVDQFAAAGVPVRTFRFPGVVLLFPSLYVSESLIVYSCSQRLMVLMVVSSLTL